MSGVFLVCGTVYALLGQVLAGQMARVWETQTLGFMHLISLKDARTGDTMPV